MTTLKSVILVLSITLLASCNTVEKNKPETILQEPTTTPKVEKLDKGQTVLNETILAHGGDLYNSANYAFTFRDNNYQFKNEGTNYTYTKTVKKGKTITIDILENDTFSRTVNDKPVTLSDKAKASATGAINSVIYFATLPYKLNDSAVNVKYIESTTIKNKNYAVIEITFNEAGGGEDHDDQFYYWINKDTKKVDYLAYSYKVNDGGVRFRSAYNSRVIDGITFQDYINYEAEVGTPLKDLPKLLEAEKLKELSKIKTENIINLNKN
ncbi:DUF6503 family protein [Psychroserpens sp. NJDZ02]|uniref:DUF6503 family protein n=1 Tax=Psychroserpens sp. NJDZ02 TaxID=2570561 RepID=UPI0010A8B3C5|nr:DUF6503 family protein [Psychroserpens sp. NJDZ02]QCE40457.1 hypothetical protein E9099_03185 [Psychroserpens sp. NJDZ02]